MRELYIVLLAALAVFAMGTVDCNANVYNGDWQIETAGSESLSSAALVAHWKLDESSGTIAYDTAGENDGVLFAALPAWMPLGGRVGGALQLDGVDDYIDCGNGAALNITGQITLAVWVKTNDAANGDHNPYLTKGNRGYAIKHHEGNKIEFFIYDGYWKTVWYYLDSSFNGVWHHLAGTYDGFELKLYIDGQLQATTPHVGSIAASSYNVNIGRNAEEPSRFYDGIIDDVRIYSSALQASEVKDLYESAFSCYYVDADVPAGGDGSSWMNALNRLQDALVRASAGNEILVAQGIYKPIQYVPPPPPPPTGYSDYQQALETTESRQASFQLINGVIIKGGYAGFGEPDPDARDIEAYETILSGDIAGDDGPNFANNSENSYHVVTGNGTDSSAVLDGFTITAGNANEDYPSQYAGGGGMYNYLGNPMVTNCTFIGNRAGYGGGMGNQTSNPVVTNCCFTGNSASADGGAMFNFSGSPRITNCTFTGNSADNNGGGIANFETYPFVINCILWGDTPDEIFEIGSSLILTFSDVQGGIGQSWFGIGCIDADPCFVDANNPDPNLQNLRLNHTSPCIDAGNNNAPYLAATDLDGHPRIIDGDCDQTTVVDMGAYEFNYAYMGDLDYNCTVDFFDFSIFGRAWMTKQSDPDWDWACDMSYPSDTYIDWRDLAILCENWLITP